MTTRGISHLSNQYDCIKALKDDCDFSWLIQHRRGFNTTPRGNFLEEFNVKMVTAFDKNKVDVVILHLDQQCLEESLLDRGKGSLYRELNEVIQDRPKIVCMHGTPFYPEKMNDIELITKAREIIGKNIMVCNSNVAKLQWAYGLEGAKKVKAGEEVENIGVPIEQIFDIHHGMDHDMYQDLPKEPRVTTMISAGGLDKYYDRSFLKAVKDLLVERDIQHCHITVDAKFSNFNEYSTFLGRSLVYFNPTRESCMPRARTEAMLSGCCVVTTPHQDADTFIEHGKNGFLIPREPQKVADLIEGLIMDYKTAIKVGQAGKETAKKLFTYDRYRKQWLEVFNVAINRFYEKK